MDNHRQIRQMLGGIGAWEDEGRLFDRQTMIGNVELATSELLREVSSLVAGLGMGLERKKPGAPLRGRADSFVAETDVSHPTDVGLLHEALRLLVIEASRTAAGHGIGGWRQSSLHIRNAKRAHRRVSTSSRQTDARVRAFLECAAALERKGAGTLAELVSSGARPAAAEGLRARLLDVRMLSGQVRRRLLLGERIPHAEKVFSLHERHTRWINKGKAGGRPELGVPVAVLESDGGYVLHHEVMWEGGDVDVAVPLVRGAQRRHPGLDTCSFDRGFHSPGNRRELDGLLENNYLPKKGYLRGEDRERETEEGFAAARRKHPAVESAINHLVHHGLGKVRTHGRDGFDRTVALAVLASNLHTLGARLMEKAARAARRRRRRPMPS